MPEIQDGSKVAGVDVERLAQLVRDECRKHKSCYNITARQTMRGSGGCSFCRSAEAILGDCICAHSNPVGACPVHGIGPQYV